MEVTQIIEGLELIYYVAGVLAANTVVSEALPFLKKYKSNGTLDLIFRLGKMAFDHFKKK